VEKVLKKVDRMDCEIIRQGKQSLTAFGTNFLLNYATLRSCTISMHIMKGDEWNILKCTLH
jgi:hypothetical protein